MFAVVSLLSLACANDTGPVQCLDGCTSSPALLGQDSTIGGCCGLQGRNGGGFLLEGAVICINCTNFRSKLIYDRQVVELMLYSCKHWISIRTLQDSVSYFLSTLF